MPIRSFKPKQSTVVSLPAGETGQDETQIKSRDSSSDEHRTQNDRKKGFPFRPFQNQKPFSPHDTLRLIPLGGVGDVTKNMYVYEYGNDILIIDCGVGFPSEEQLGVDLVIPDISYLKGKEDKIKGIVITHAHDDHIGGLPYIWPQLKAPIYSQKLSCGMIKAKFREHNLPLDHIKEMKITDTVRLGVFEVSVYQVSHSIPDSTGIIIRTPVGIIVHQADFKMDWTPVNGQVTDLGKVAKIAEEGILLMNIDCLRVEKKGYTLSEKTIQGTFTEVEKNTKGKVLITMTSSNVTRIQQAVNVAVASGRKMALSGRSLENNFQVARDLGYLDVPTGLVVPQEEIKRFPDEKLMVLIAGSQGQPGSSLSRAANNDHRFVFLKKNDAVVFSADPIPSTESAQSALIDRLSRLGCDVYYSAMTSDLHVSGHAAQEELKVMVSVAKPKYIMPIGGEFRHMKAFSSVAQDMGYKAEQILLPEDGNILEVTKAGVKINGRVEVSNVYVDGYGVGDVGAVVLRDRQVMSEEGVVVVIVSVDKHSGETIGEPDIISRGFVYEKEAEDLIDAAREIVKSVLRDNPKGFKEWRYLRHQIEENLEKFFYQETQRRPMIVSVLVDL